MKTFKEWKSEIESGIQRLQAENRKYYYLMSAKMTKEVAASIRKWLETLYTIEMTKCGSCKNSYDIIVSLIK